MRRLIGGVAFLFWSLAAGAAPPSSARAFDEAAPEAGLDLDWLKEPHALADACKKGAVRCDGDGVSETGKDRCSCHCAVKRKGDCRKSAKFKTARVACENDARKKGQDATGVCDRALADFDCGDACLAWSGALREEGSSKNPVGAWIHWGVFEDDALICGATGLPNLIDTGTDRYIRPLASGYSIRKCSGCSDLSLDETVSLIGRVQRGEAVAGLEQVRARKLLEEEWRPLQQVLPFFTRPTSCQLPFSMADADVRKLSFRRLATGSYAEGHRVGQWIDAELRAGNELFPAVSGHFEAGSGSSSTRGAKPRIARFLVSAATYGEGNEADQFLRLGPTLVFGSDGALLEAGTFEAVGPKKQILRTGPWKSFEAGIVVREQTFTVLRNTDTGGFRSTPKGKVVGRDRPSGFAYELSVSDPADVSVDVSADAITAAQNWVIDNRPISQCTKTGNTVGGFGYCAGDVMALSQRGYVPDKATRVVLADMQRGTEKLIDDAGHVRRITELARWRGNGCTSFESNDEKGITLCRNVDTILNGAQQGIFKAMPRNDGFVPDGLVTEFASNGQPLRVARYSLGFPVGPEIHWGPDGRTSEIILNGLVIRSRVPTGDFFVPLGNPDSPARAAESFLRWGPGLGFVSSLGFTLATMRNPHSLPSLGPLRCSPWACSESGDDPTRRSNLAKTTIPFLDPCGGGSSRNQTAFLAPKKNVSKIYCKAEADCAGETNPFGSFGMNCIENACVPRREDGSPGTEWPSFCKSMDGGGYRQAIPTATPLSFGDAALTVMPVSRRVRILPDGRVGEVRCVLGDMVYDRSVKPDASAVFGAVTPSRIAEQVVWLSRTPQMATEAQCFGVPMLPLPLVSEVAQVTSVDYRKRYLSGLK